MPNLRILLSSLLIVALVQIFSGCVTHTVTVKERPTATDVSVSDVAVKTSSLRYIIVEIRGIDEDGFELKDFDLKSDVAPGQAKVLTDTRFMKEINFKKVVRWQVGEISYGE